MKPFFIAAVISLCGLVANVHVSGNTAGTIEIFENLSGAEVAEPSWAAPRKLEVDGRPFRIMAGPNGSIQGPAEA